MIRNKWIVALAVAVVAALSIGLFGFASSTVVGKPAPAGEVTCLGEAVTILGTYKDDIIVGTEEADVIHGLSGNDLIFGLGDDDTLCATYYTVRRGR